MTTSNPIPPNMPLLAVRSCIGGFLMGLANLVPGISGGTMLLAAGIYPRFVQAIAELSTFRFRLPSLLVLGCVVCLAVLAILTLAGTVKNLVVHQRWVMYSLFIGLTLGGVPIVWRLLRERGVGFWVGVGAGLTGMVGLVLAQNLGVVGSDPSAGGFLFFALAGVVGASAMVLPGVSGGYLWLVLGVYVPILGAISACKDALTARDFAALGEPLVDVVIPLGIGVVVGVVVVSNAVNWALNRYRAVTLGVLLGLLVGAVVGLWPFQQGVAPEVGSTMKGQTVSQSASGELILAESGRAVEPDDYPTQFFSPSGVQIGSSLLLILGGFVFTTLIGHIGSDDAGP